MGPDPPISISTVIDFLGVRGLPFSGPSPNETGSGLVIAKNALQEEWLVCFESRLQGVAAKNGIARLSLYVDVDVLVEDVDVEVEVDVLVLVLVDEPALDVDELTSVPVSLPAREIS